MKCKVVKNGVGLIFLITILLVLTSCELGKEKKCETCRGITTITCSTCNGKGADLCDVCDGNGRCYRSNCASGKAYNEKCSACKNGIITNPFTWESYTCGRCDGLGYLKGDCTGCDGTGKCYSCDGSGLAKNAETCENCTGNGRVDCPYCE